jgi:DNA-binding CsgD family transcriptional regulator
VEIYESLHASRDLARADAVLRQAGIRRGRKRPHAPARVGWESLTSTETTITVLVAEGLSSPQIGERLYISRRTVQTHLAHIFAKLDMSSRAQLAASVTRRQGSA